MNTTLKRKARILVVDEHPLIRLGVASLLAGERDITVVAEAGDAAQALAGIARAKPDVVLMDLQLPDVSERDAIALLIKANPNSCFIVVTAISGDLRARRAFEAGARAPRGCVAPAMRTRARPLRRWRCWAPSRARSARRHRPP